MIFSHCFFPSVSLGSRLRPLTAQTCADFAWSSDGRTI